MLIDQDPTTRLTDEDRFHDIVDGRRIVKILSVRDIFFLNNLLQAMGKFDLDERLGRLFIGLSYDLGLSDGNRRMPDLSFVSGERWPMNRRLPDGDYWEMVPDLVADIITPGTPIDVTRRKLDDYKRTGVRLVWLIFPENERVTVCLPDSQKVLGSENDFLDGGDILPGFRMSLADLFNDRF